MPRFPDAPIAPARRVAYVVLRRTFERGAYTDLALRAEARELNARDRALAMALASGAVQRRGTLDHLIAQLSDRRAERIDAPLLAALRLGLYELLYMAGAPDYAVVHDAVQLAKAHARAGHGLVNAVLRRAARESHRGLLAPLRDGTPEQAAIKHSHPRWLARMWFEQLGAAEARALMAHDNEPAELALRANTLVTDAGALAGALPVASRRDPDIPEALVLDGPFDAHASRAWREGAFVAQSRAAMLVSHALGPVAGERVLDLCAAPGGKATHLAALMGGEGEVVAVERDGARARRLVETARRLRVRNVRVVVADAREPIGERAFDRVLVDPPCSGLGTLQARPDLRWRASTEAISQMARAQGEILASGAEALRPGGVLVYATCTISATENEQVIAAFRDSHADFSLEDLAAQLPVNAPSAIPGAALTLPHRHHTAGFFVARLRRS